MMYRIDSEFNTDWKTKVPRFFGGEWSLYFEGGGAGH